jgi:hypothetical protein
MMGITHKDMAFARERSNVTIHVAPLSLKAGRELASQGIQEFMNKQQVRITSMNALA